MYKYINQLATGNKLTAHGSIVWAFLIGEGKQKGENSWGRLEDQVWVFSRVQRDSICHFVGRSVCLSVCPAFAFSAVLSILSHFKSIKKI